MNHLGLAVDRENAWICHLSYTHKVAVAWEGREKVSRERLMKEYNGKRSLRPSIRKKRLKPLNDLFSMAECCLISDTVEFLKNSGIPFCRKSVVNDVLSVIGQTHISGNFHRKVAEMPEKYFEPNPHLQNVIESLKKAGKRLILVRYDDNYTCSCVNLYHSKTYQKEKFHLFEAILLFGM